MEEVRDGLKKGGSLLNYARAIIGAVVAPSLVFIRDRVLLKRPEGTREGVVIMVTTPRAVTVHITDRPYRELISYTLAAIANYHNKQIATLPNKVDKLQNQPPLRFQCCSSFCCVPFVSCGVR